MEKIDAKKNLLPWFIIFFGVFLCENRDVVFLHYFLGQISFTLVKLKKNRGGNKPSEVVKYFFSSLNAQTLHLYKR